MLSFGKRLFWVFSLAAWLQSPLTQAAESKRARIESIDGAKTVLLQRGLALRDAAPGDEIQVGERIRTDAQTTVQVVYPDGSKLTVHPGSDLELDKPEGGVQSNLLR